MKTQYRYIEFKPWGNAWRCFNRTSGDLLAKVEYFAPWREWEILPLPGTGYTVECLRDIAEFLGQLPKP